MMGQGGGLMYHDRSEKDDFCYLGSWKLQETFILAATLQNIGPLVPET